MENTSNTYTPSRGIFHLLYRDKWIPEFISDECLNILACEHGCGPGKFVEVLLSACPFSQANRPGKSIGDLLQELAPSNGSLSFNGLLWPNRESLPYVLGTLNVVFSPSGMLQVYGSLFDRSAYYAKAEKLHFIEEEYQASLQMSNRTLYHYMVDKRRAILPAEFAREMHSPEIIDNFPEWNVQKGNISPESITTWYNIFDSIEKGEPCGKTAVIFSSPDGSKRRISIEFSTLKNESEEPVSAIITYLDITEQYEFNRKQGLDRDGLLQVVRLVFPEILSINLTKGTYRMIQYYQATTLNTPLEGSLLQMLELRINNMAAEDQEAFREIFYPEGMWRQYNQGKEILQLAYRRIGKDKVWHWTETTAIRQTNPYDDDILFIAVTRNIDQQKQDEENLRQDLVNAYEYKIAEEKRINIEERLKKNEQIFQIAAQHSNRTLYYYDIACHEFRPWAENNAKATVFSQLFGQPYIAERIDNDPSILPESIQPMKQMFSDIHEGKPLGEAHIHARTPEGKCRWFHFKFSSIFEENKPVTALISFEDVTEQHEKDMAHLRFIQSISERSEDHLVYIEVDLTTDTVEKRVGSPRWKEGFCVGSSYSEGCRMLLNNYVGHDSSTASDYYSPASLMQKFKEGCYDFENVWEANSQTGESLWLQVHVELLTDSFSGHLKMFVHITDITSNQKDKLAMSRRADYDAMTGLLRRGVGTERIKKLLASSTENAGIMILLDLDDLKGINDTLGHAQGDKAIIGIAETLSSHFRKDDILIRMGGDEFLVFLQGAAKNVNSVSLAMTSLLQKLSSISIGENDERCIHCSAGCSVQATGEDDFDTLYRHADVALYHVKRNGKNNFAFFEKEMLLEDYQFKKERTLPKVQGNLNNEEMSQLLDTISLHFQGIVFFDLSNNLYRILEAVEDEDTIPPSDNMEVFWEIISKRIHPEDREVAAKALTRASLVSAYKNGRRGIKYSFRYQQHDNGYFPFETEVHFYTSQSGDIYAYALFSKNR
ncbi:MAG: diguanylate cyclase domain-containing protein [Lachnospiraceae bacterium]